MAVNTTLEGVIGTLALGLALGVTWGCGGDDDESVPAPAGGTVEGDYTISLTSRENGCDFPNWNEGESASGISFEVTTDGTDATGVVTGVGAAAALIVALGPDGNVFEGSASGGNLTLTSYGTVPLSEGACLYTINATIAAAVDGDVIQGNISYTAATNDNPDCAGIEGCISRQEFNGTRPPS